MPNDPHDPLPDPHRDNHDGKDAPPNGPNGPSGPNRPAGPIGPRRNPMTWLIILGALVLWNVFAIWPRGAQQVELPYSTFIAQVKADDVTSVNIGVNTISGVFVNPYTPPAPSPATNAATSAPASTGTTSATNSPATAATTKTATTAPTNGATNTATSPATAAPANAATNGAATTKPEAQTPSEPPPTFTDFTTNFPVSVGDANLMPLLNAHNVTIAASPPSNPWLGTLLLGILPIGLLLLFVVWMGRRAQQSSQGMFGMGQSKARRYDVEHPTVTFSDVAGADEAKDDLQEVVDFLRHPARYHALGARTPKGFLLVGPPGTGKTLLARAVAGEAKVPFFNLSASEFVEMFVGVGASRVRDLFKQAHDAAPSIVFIDELDAVGRRRGAGMGAVNDEREQTLNQMLVAMDGFDELHEVIVLAATNRPDVLDPALLRPGRFDREVTVGLPDQRGREAILRIHARPLPLGDDVDLGLMARSTTGFSGADLANLCNQAALEAARRKGDDVTMADFELAVDRLVLGDSRSLIMSEADRKVIAYHEAGHAVVAWYNTHTDPVRKVTIIPHGRALGVTEQAPEADIYNLGETALLERLSVMMGGRASEALVLSEITTGAENDFAQATALARRMVARWGMGPMGPVTLENDDQQPFLGYSFGQGRGISEATAARLDEAVQTLLRSRFDDATAMLRKRRDRLDILASTLLEVETVGQGDLIRLLGPRAGDNTTATERARSLEPVTEPRQTGTVQGVHGAAAAAAMLRS